MTMLVAKVLAAVFMLNTNVYGRPFEDYSICKWRETNGYCTDYTYSYSSVYKVVERENGPCGYVYLYKLEGHTGFQGIWEQTGDTKNGAFIYKKDLGYYGKWHLWLEWHRYYKAWGWAIGSNPNKYGDWWVFNWGPTLVDSDWIWYRDMAGQWHHDTDATTSCSDLCNLYDCCCDAAIPPIYAPSNMTDGAEMMSVPPPPGWSTDTVPDDDANHEIVAGAAVGAVAVVVIVVAMLMIRKKRNGPKSAASVHIPEASQTDIAVQIGTGNEAVGSAATGTQESVTGNEAVEVVEDDVAPKLDEVVNVGQEQ